MSARELQMKAIEIETNHARVASGGVLLVCAILGWVA
jgi:hypothetical protein